VSVQSLSGLFLLNGLVIVAGLGLLSAIRGPEPWRALARLAGLAYLLGLAAVGVVLVLELVIGIPFGLVTVVLTALGLAAAGFAVRLRRAGSPPLGEPRVPISPVVTGVGAALAVVYVEASFRSGRLALLGGWDAMGFWVPKAKTIYFFGGLDEQLFREITNSSYPPLVPALQAAAFEFMGSADTETLHLLFWFPLVAFIAAVAGLLAPRVPALLLWPALLLVALTPELVDRALAPMADIVLDYFVALAALLTVLWLIERARWQLILAAVFLSAAMVTKREGLMLAACIVAAALIVSLRRWRRTWPPLLVAAAASVLPLIAWQIWFRSHGISGQGPTAGGIGVLDHLDRAWPSFELALDTLFDHNLWLVVMPLAVAGILLALLAGARVLPAFVGLLTVFAVAGFTWSTWAWLEFPITKDPAVNPISRVTGGLVIALAGLLPLLFHAAWRGDDQPEAGA
jgi:hypothetical protein